ncbi:c-type cytochrome [Gemmata sp. G18]|uniref:C-type cytochrome n=1 Tax=Gemmata palustris TaxID=2822762 RepID=A0ABS5C683_9BACT|nr:c-type cytochrome [Gemmata palustris]MBP3960613.1 c-type cytochrome [Gemmata palustris]
MTFVEIATDTAPAPRAVLPAAEPIDAGAPNALNVLAIAGANEAWTFQHPSGRRERNELHLPVGRAVKFSLAREGEEGLSVGGNQLAIPAFPFTVGDGRDKTAAIKPMRAGAFGLWNSRERIGTAFVTAAAEYERFAKDGAASPVVPVPVPAPVDGTLALKGRQLFLKFQCVNCHSATATAKAPLLEGLYETKVAIKGGGTQLVDETYIVESIRKPRAKVVEGWDAVMPAYDAELLSDADLNAMVAYIKSLKRGTQPKEPPVPVPAPVPVGSPADPRRGPEEVVGRRESAGENGIRRAPK